MFEPESIERVSVGTGSGSSETHPLLQPLDRQVGGWDWGEGKQGAWGTEFQEIPAPEVQVQSQHSTVRLLILHTLGATLVRGSTGSEAEAMGADSGSITAWFSTCHLT